MSTESTLLEDVAIGIAQTTVDSSVAWRRNGDTPQMSQAQDAHVWGELRKAMRYFKDGTRKPKIIVFPELSLPRTRLDDFDKLVCSLNSIVFVGADYRLSSRTKQARNQGMVFVPNGFWRGKGSRHCTRITFGKTHGSPGELSALNKLTPPWTFVGDDNVYIFDAGEYGRIGVSICYDFMDLERAVMYRGKIHHLLVLAYNRDLGMFKSLAESLSRTVFCNVVVCNTGFFGGSVCVTPYFEAHKRTLYGHNGNRLFTTQVVDLPVAGLAEALQGSHRTTTATETIKTFKDPPPGVSLSPVLQLSNKKLG